MDLKVTIKRNRQTGEYICRLWYEGVHYKHLDYFTDDKDDAVLTARAMQKDFENKVINAYMGNAKVKHPRNQIT